MYLAIVFIPLLNFLVAGFFGRFLGKKGVSFFSATLMVLTSLGSVISFYYVALKGHFYYVNLGTWISSDSLIVHWGFVFDTLTVSMFVVVNFISTLVHIYSISYMSEDPHIVRFLSYLSFFTFFMLILVSADNFIQMFLGWEGVGLCSYLLINFWFTRIQANKAAIKALLINRVGDFGLSLGILLVFVVFGSFDFSTVFNPLCYNILFDIGIWDNLFFSDFGRFFLLDAICILLFIGAIGKSAQIGLHTWLPDAMEGPTPVSALIHAATMVTAGVFLIIRCSPLFELSEHALIVITLFGSLTAFFAATAGLVQNDIKKVIAYSTCSQLGYMIFACGLSNYSASFFHLSNHAFFKALLFLSAGAVIHGIANEQDMRRMGGLINILPFTYVMVLIGSLSLMGFPFLTGFYSKDYILELAFANWFSNRYSPICGIVSFWFGTTAAFFTAFYSFRLIYLVFLSRVNMFKSSAKAAHELPLIMAIPLGILCLGSIFLGYLSKEMFVGVGSPFFNNSLPDEIENTHYLLFSEEFVPYKYKILPVALSMLGCILLLLIQFVLENCPIRFFSVSFFKTKCPVTGKKGLLKKLYIYLVFKWNFDVIYNNYIIKNILLFGYNVTYKSLDKGIIEVFGPYGIPKFLSKNLAGSFTKNNQYGMIYGQVNFMLFTALLFVCFYYFIN